MAWRCSGRSHEELVRKLVDSNLLFSNDCHNAFRQVDRAHFLGDNPDLLAKAYQDTPVKEGPIHQSAPHMYAMTLQHLDLKPGHDFLNVGSGTGYLSTLAAYFTGPEGTNHGVEVVSSVVELSVEAVRTFQKKEGIIGVPIHFKLGNALNLDFKRNIQYDRINIGCACTLSQIQHFTEGLKPGGFLLAPVHVSQESTEFQKIQRSQDSMEFSTETLTSVRYADLVDPGEERTPFIIESRAEREERNQLIRCESSDESPDAAQRGFYRYTDASEEEDPTGDPEEQVEESTEAPRAHGGLRTRSNKCPVMVSVNLKSGQAMAEEVKSFVETLGMDCWLCTDCIGPGQSFRKEIIRAVSGCSLCIPIVTKEWLQSPECEFEFNMALNLYLHKDKGSRKIVPLVEPNFTWDNSEDLWLAITANFNCTPWKDWKESVRGALGDLNLIPSPKKSIVHKEVVEEVPSSPASTVSAHSESLAARERQLAEREKMVLEREKMLMEREKAYMERAPVRTCNCL